MITPDRSADAGAGAIGCNVAAIVKDYGMTGGKVLTLEPHLYEFVGLKGLEQEGDESVVGTMFFDTPEAAFDFAVKTLKEMVVQF